MIEILDFADKLLGLVPLVLQTGGDVMATITKGRQQIAAMKAANRGPTDDEWAALNAEIDGLMGQLK